MLEAYGPQGIICNIVHEDSESARYKAMQTDAMISSLCSVNDY
jgi:hypothetical protein